MACLELVSLQKAFSEEIQTRVYSWDLKDLSISQSGAEWDESMYQLLRRSIPSVECCGVSGIKYTHFNTAFNQ